MTENSVKADMALSEYCSDEIIGGGTGRKSGCLGQEWKKESGGADFMWGCQFVRWDQIHFADVAVISSFFCFRSLFFLRMNRLLIPTPSKSRKMTDKAM